MIKEIQKGFRFVLEAHKVFQIDEAKHHINMVA
jgi:hypothetical protein